MSGRQFETSPAMAGPAPAQQAGQTQAWRPGPPASGGATADGHQRLDLAGTLLLQLQREYGNRYVQRVVALGRHGGPVSGVPVPQAKLALGPPRDRYEREADRVARVVARSAEDGRGPRAGTGRADEPVPLPPDIQRLHGGPAGAVDATVERAIWQARGAGRPLPSSIRGPMEQELGADFDGVRLHTDARADQLSRSLQALAFTAGNDIFFRGDGYSPDSDAGRQLLAHELTHVAQQRSGTGQPTVQRYIVSVNHGLRDPKGNPKDDYGTYRSLDVALAAGGGEVYKGSNTAEKGGRLDQLKDDSEGIELGKHEDLFLVGHGEKDKVGVLSPKTVAEAVVNITPDNWEGNIFSLNCWSAYRSKADTPSALESVETSLAKTGRKVSATGPVGRSIRHKDWLGEEDAPLGTRAVVGALTKDEETVYKGILTEAATEAGIQGKVEDAFDTSLRQRFRAEIEDNQPIGVEKKASFATEWGRVFQASVVTRLKNDQRLGAAIAQQRLLFGKAGAYGDVLEPRRGWTWRSLAGVGLVGLVALGAGLALFRHLRGSQ